MRTPTVRACGSVLTVVVLCVALVSQTSRSAEAFAPALAPVVLPPILAVPAIGAAGTTFAGAGGAAGAVAGAGVATGAGIAFVGAAVVAAGGLVLGWGAAQAVEWAAGWNDPEPGTTARWGVYSAGSYTAGTALGASTVPASAVSTKTVAIRGNSLYKYYCVGGTGGAPWQGRAPVTDPAGQMVPVTLSCAETSHYGAGAYIYDIRAGSNLSTAGYYDSWRAGQVVAGEGGTSVATGVQPAHKRQLRTRAECTGADRGPPAVVEQTSDPFTVDQALPATPGLVCPADTRMTRFEAIRESVPGQGSVLAPVPLLEGATPSDQLDPAHQYAGCLVGPQCSLDVRQLQPDGSHRSCVDDINCADWSRWDNRQDFYQCTWGEYVLPLEQCAPLERWYQPQPEVVPITEPQPALPSPEVAPNPELDPNQPPPQVQPQPMPEPMPAPNPYPERPPLDEPVESPTGTATGRPDAPSAAPANDPDCESPESVWEYFNPALVFRGALCAIANAFVPSPATSSRLGAVPELFVAVAPFSWVVGFSQWLSPITGLGQECPEWVLTVTEGYRVNVVCDSTFVGALRQFRPVLLVALLLIAFSRLVWSMWYAAMPIIKPSRGGD